MPAFNMIQLRRGVAPLRGCLRRSGAAPVETMDETPAARNALLGSGIAALSFGAVFTRLADGPPAAVAALRMVFSACLLVAPALGSARIRRELGSLNRGEWGALAAAGGFLALHFLLWISSLSGTGVASSVVLVTTSPLWIGLYSIAVLRKRAPRAFWAGLAIALAGGAIIGGGAGGRIASGGNMLALGGAVAIAGYFIVGSALRRRLSIVAYVFPVYATAAALLVLAVAGSGGSLGGQAPRTYLYTFLMALVCQTVGHSIFNWALRSLDAGAVAVATLGEPVGAAALAYLILGEAPVPATALGGALVLGGIVIVLRRGAFAAAAGHRPSGR